MERDEIIKYCLDKPGVWDDLPFDEKTLVLKVGSKMFILFGESRINLKCDPENAIELRQKYKAITPGYHMNKRHWNTVLLDDSISKEVIGQMIDDSYELVFKSLTKAEKEKIKR